MEASDDFWNFMRSTLLEKAATYPGSLEEYLRALWALIQEHRESPVSYSLIASILAEALTRAPPPFDERWLSYTDPPENIFDGGNSAAIEDDYSCLQQMILYQIADLHQMGQAGMLQNKYRYYGIESPAGLIWYNFDPEAFLNCATAGFSEVPTEEPTSDECNWTDLAALLWLGQNYE